MLIPLRSPAMDPRSKQIPALWRAPITHWTISLQAAGQSRATIATRADHMRRAARALGGDPWSVTAAALIEWVGTRQWATETRRSMYGSLKRFWQWGHDEGLHTGPLPTARLPRVKAAPPQPRPAPAPVIQRAHVGADDRLRLILRLAAEAGMRRAEIAQVHSRDLIEDLDGWSLRVHGKGDKERVVPLNQSLSRAVMAACLAGGGWALPGDDNGHLSPRWVGKLATKALPGDWTLHTLRHRFATDVNTATGDLLVVQELLGHASVATTQRYVATPRDRLRGAVNAIAA